ncbi:crotonobetaine/carnitine-CoA ligase [Novosphingobium barchaimii LL02]|uniref:Crotonobetaine/carnitine-CoA ligase n=1 Tax=Novosphingobium barchaimii LL02 TaxID=1114963 RepID=A0A0J7XNQ5_9SPHN|nr:AMP-binding protein [Novosphingobium barchaimii]KMS53561.1 crotonobetaine/carnitine-CoA ligase [Novosphingobium barchaimii LL02]
MLSSPEFSSAATIYGAFCRAVEAWRDHEFLHAPAEALGGAAAITLTYGEADRRVQQRTAVYASAGFGPGHRVGLMLANHPEFFIHFLALNAIGASIVPLNEAMRDVELCELVAQADMDLIVTWQAQRSRLAAIAADAMPIGDALADAMPRAQRPSTGFAPDETSEAAMLFTSGTTGKPKGCILSNAYFTGIGALYIGLGGHCAFVPGQDRILTPLPVTHMNALACSFMAAMLSGGCLVQLDRFHASSWWHTVRETGATIVHYLGVMPAILLQRDDAKDAWEGHAIRFAFGAGVDPRHHAVFEERFGFPLIEAWAMSETGAGAWITANHEPRHVGTRCFGRPQEDLEYRLIDENGRDVAVGTAGELLVRASGSDPRRYFFSGYYKDASATEAAWRGGWFHTGDIVRRDHEGSLFFVDRSKNIVRRSGENIAAVEVEGVLMLHDAVRACAVMPVADEIRGEEVMALVETACTGDAEEARDIAAFCLEKLQYFKIPGYIAFVDALPTTASQKLQRGAIRALGRDLLEGGLAHDLRALKRSRG